MVWSGDKPDWTIDGRDWPHREASAFVTAGSIRWHVQQYGRGRAALLLHGTGASSHSFADLGAALSEDCRVVAPDLPGHGFTDTPRFSSMSLPGMAACVGDLTSALQLEFDIVVGHSAGAAVLVEMISRNLVRPRALISINGALAPFDGVGGLIFPALAKLLFLNPFVPALFAQGAGRAERIARLIEETGSRPPPRNVELYARLLRRAGHASGALAMMANWDLSYMADKLRRLPIPALFVAGENDRAVPPDQARIAASLAPNGRSMTMTGAGHLAHEERPAEVAALIRAFAAETGL